MPRSDKDFEYTGRANGLVFHSAGEVPLSVSSADGRECRVKALRHSAAESVITPLFFDEPEYDQIVSELEWEEITKEELLQRTTSNGILFLFKNHLI